VYNRVGTCGGETRGGDVAARWRHGTRAAALAAGLALALLFFTAVAPRPSAQPGSDQGICLQTSVDLDGDGTAETIGLGHGRGGVSIEDGVLSYTSRDKWQVVATAIGDTDGNGLPEIVALLDGPDGRHIGLFAWFGGRYRERMVSAALSPAPVSLRLLAVPAGSREQGSLVELRERLPEVRFGEAPRYVTTLYRWNGFGYAAVNPGTVDTAE
jgi:hypothetical protein